MGHNLRSLLVKSASCNLRQLDTGPIFLYRNRPTLIACLNLLFLLYIYLYTFNDERRRIRPFIRNRVCCEDRRAIHVVPMCAYAADL